MRKMAAATLHDLPLVMKAFRRTQEAMHNEGDFHYDDGYPNEDIFKEEIDNGSLFVLKENGRVLGFFSVYHNVKEYFCPESKSSMKAFDLLDLINFNGEMVTIIGHFMVDPAFWGEGIGNEMAAFIKAKYKKSSFLFAVYESNEYARRFWKRQGFFEFGPLPEPEWDCDPCILMGRPLLRSGLASISF